MEVSQLELRLRPAASSTVALAWAPECRSQVAEILARVRARE